MALFLPMAFDDDFVYRPYTSGPLHHPYPRHGHDSVPDNAHQGQGGQRQKRETIKWNHQEDQFTLELKLVGFEHDDIRIGLDTQHWSVRILASHEEKSEDGVMTNKQFAKVYYLPEDSIPNKLQWDYVEGTIHITLPQRSQKHNSDEDCASLFEIFPKWVQSGHFSEVRGQEIQDKDELFEVSMQLDGFKPEDISVNISPQGILVISGQLKEKKTDKVVTVKQIYKSFVLPKNCKLDDITTKFTKGGQLSVIAPKDQERCVRGNRKLQINYED